MNILNNKLIVIYDETHNKVFNVGGIELIRPDEWVHKAQEAGDSTHTTYQENTNYLETKPQIATVTHANIKYPFKEGDKIFLHYMAHVGAAYFNEDTKECYVDASYVFFTYLPDCTWKMADGVYFGEQVFDDEEVTPSGIILTQKRAQLCQVKLTNLPENSEFEQDEVILTIDRYNYPVTIDGRNLIMLREHEIVGRLWQDQ